MKFVAILLGLFCVAYASQEIDLKTPIQIDAATNEKFQDAIKEIEVGNKSILDELPNMIFDLIVSVIGNSDLDPFDLPDLNTYFEHRPNWITYTGEFNLTEGNVGGFSQIQRNGDADIRIFLLERRANMRMPISFEALRIMYNYDVRLMGFGPNGIFSGSFEELTATLDIDINLVTFTPTLNEFSLNAERFVFNFEGNPLSDWLANILINIVAERVREPIINAVEAVFNVILNAVFDAISAAPTIEYF